MRDDNIIGCRSLENREKEMLSPRAALSSESRGREKGEEQCSLRTIFQNDRDRILHSKAFRRLKHKTQVFIAPAGDHYRTRLTHTLEVSQISRTIARALGLNEDLTEAISLGHDLGHTPFGHAGEKVLDELSEQGFCHNEHSLRVVDHLEGDGEERVGLNLTHEVRDGILHHTGSELPVTLEGQIVRLADRVAYINHDIDDSLRAGILSRDELPDSCLKVLGETHSKRIDTMVRDIIEASSGENEIKMSVEIDELTAKLRGFLFENVYIGSQAKKEECKAQRLLRELFEFYHDSPREMPAEYHRRAKAGQKEQAVVDYIAGMTDRYAIKKGQEMFIPTPWS